MQYDNLHNIVRKNQQYDRTTSDGSVQTQRATSYNHNYRYDATQPHAPSRIGNRAYAYDRNGNQSGWLEQGSNQRRSISWDEENRIRAIDDNGRVTAFVYDDAGERAMKVGHGETAYVNQYFTVRNRNLKTKHVWLGTSRMVSKLVPGDGELDDGDGDGGDEQPKECDPNHTHGRGFPDPGHTHGNGHGPFHCHGESDDGSEPPPPEEEEPPPCALDDEPAELNFIYYYHPDHLGSTSFITDCHGLVYRHDAYYPFGETWVEQASDTWRTPYLFTGKELDEETGLYYYGARYYDPRTSVLLPLKPDDGFGRDLDPPG